MGLRRECSVVSMIKVFFPYRNVELAWHVAAGKPASGLSIMDCMRRPESSCIPSYVQGQAASARARGVRRSLAVIGDWRARSHRAPARLSPVCSRAGFGEPPAGRNSCRSGQSNVFRLLLARPRRPSRAEFARTRARGMRATKVPAALAGQRRRSRIMLVSTNASYSCCRLSRARGATARTASAPPRFERTEQYSTHSKCRPTRNLGDHAAARRNACASSPVITQPVHEFEQVFGRAVAPPCQLVENSCFSCVGCQKQQRQPAARRRPQAPASLCCLCADWRAGMACNAAAKHPDTLAGSPGFVYSTPLHVHMACSTAPITSPCPAQGSRLARAQRLPEIVLGRSCA
jgi:hypothetical protein